jgi:tetratricopeptide (TPR) repeat protein
MRRFALAAAAAALCLGACRPSCGCSRGGAAGQPEPAGAPVAGEPSPEVPDAIRSLRDAEAAFQKGALDEAVIRAEAAAAAAPSNPVAWNVLGRARAARYQKSRDEAEANKAREAFQRAAAASPDFWPAFQNLGELDEKTGRLQEAADAYRKVLKAQPDHPEKARFQATIDQAEQAARSGKK